MQTLEFKLECTNSENDEEKKAFRSMSVDGDRKNHIAEKLEHILKLNFCFNSQKKAHEKKENKRTNDERYKKLEQHFFFHPFLRFSNQLEMASINNEYFHTFIMYS